MDRLLVVGVVLVLLTAAVVVARTGAKEPMAPASTNATTPGTLRLAVFDDRGTLTSPVPLPKLILSDDQWRSRLTPEQFRILRSAGTERPFCGMLLDNKQEGVYTCAGCNLPLFTSSAKFNSGTGWPSFFQPIAPTNIAERKDTSHGMVRTEINCARCDGHLGHVFDDGPRPTGLRYCLNSESLKFTEATQLASLAEVSQAVFAGGCFWCVEAVFEELDGVLEAESGYTGGNGPTTYKDVCTGTTGHAEAVRIVYLPSKISYEQLLDVHFATHDPTTLNRQGADVGTQYRSAIFFTDNAEKAKAQAFIDTLTAKGAFQRPIVTTLEPLGIFYIAEEYHQNYVCNNPNQGYVRGVAVPKVAKVRAKFPEKLKSTAADESAAPAATVPAAEVPAGNP